MRDLLSTLLEEFASQLPKDEECVKREGSLTDVPNMINVAIGVRRSGKTYLAYQYIRDLLKQGVLLQQILYINFEDDRLLPMGMKELGALLDMFYTLYPENHDRECYFFLDEIQNVEDWALVVRRFFDSKKLKIFLTGSSAKLLSKEIATSLRGRSISTEVWPYSFAEYLEAQDIAKPKPPIGKKVLDYFYHHLSSYFFIGGFPAVQKLHENERRTILQSYVNAVIFRDIVERYKITNISVVKHLIKSLIKNVAAPFSVNKFFNELKSQGIKVGKDTLYQYLEYLEDAFLIFSVPIFSESVRKTQVNPKKIYAVDVGLVTANRLDIAQNLGALFENHIYLDLRRQQAEVYYYKTKEEYEIDFVVKYQDGTMELLQIVWDMSDADTMKREKRALDQAKQELGLPGRIVTPQNYLFKRTSDS